MELSSDQPQTVTQQGGGWMESQAGPLGWTRAVLSQGTERKDSLSEVRAAGGAWGDPGLQMDAVCGQLGPLS